jgi:hypothetical protein
MWRSPAFPMWLTLAAAAFFGLVVLITLLRAEKSVANGALTVITLLAIGVAVAATIRDYGPTGRTSAEIRGTASATASLPALACIDELAGDAVASACEKVVFASPESTAAAVSYTASLITRLTALGDVAAAKASMTPELLAMRRALERDRYGMVAQVLVVREGCTGIQCPAFRSFADSRQISINMTERNYDAMVSHYATMWNASSALSPMAALGPPSLPTGKPTNAEFPSAASTPAVSIMNPEPTSGTPPNGQRPAQAAVSAQKQPPPATAPAAPTAAMASAKKPAPKRPASAAPAQLAPGAAPAPAQAPSDNE